MQPRTFSATGWQVARKYIDERLKWAARDLRTLDDTLDTAIELMFEAETIEAYVKLSEPDLYARLGRDLVEQQIERRLRE